MLNGLELEITDFFKQAMSWPDNKLEGTGGELAWDDFLLGAALGADEIFDKFTEAVGPEFDKPAALFKKAFPDICAAPEELSILCWVLPQRESVRAANRAQNLLPAEIWGHAKADGEKFYLSLGTALEKFFADKGIPAFFPMGHSDIVKRFPSEKRYVTSNWSERHACYAAGLGTFGLCDALITPAGKAHRCGSIIIKAQLPPTPRDYSGFHDYCPWFTKGSCGMCIKRCPSGALSEKGHNKQLCEKYLHEVCMKFFNEHGFEVSACGLCQTGVPCEDRIPGRPKITPVRGFLQRA